MRKLEPGTYDLQSLLGMLSGADHPSQDFAISITRWRDLRTVKIDLDYSEEDTFIRGIIHEQSAEKLRPFVEILSNSIDACIEHDGKKPSLELVIRINADGSYVIEISDKGIGSGMSTEVFVQKYLPPSASTKGQVWSSSIGQMGVGANQQYSLIMREGDEILLTTTDETGHATLMGVRTKDNSLQATLAAGTVPPTQVEQGLDKQGTLTRITLSKETAREIGFTPNIIAGYLADRFGSYQQADLSLRVVGKADNVQAMSILDDYGCLTPDAEYARALKISVDRLQQNRSSVGNKVEVTYKINPEVSEETHFIYKANLGNDYLVNDVAEKNKNAVLQVSKEKSDISLVYLSVLGVRFGQPIVIKGHDVPATIDVKLDYRIGQISESRSEIRLNEFDYLRLAALISSLEKREDIPLEVRLKIAISLVGLCDNLDKQSPNKLRYDINLTRKLEQTISFFAKLLDKSKLWPGEFESLKQDATAIVIPPKMVGEYLFDYAALGFCRVDMLQSNKGEIYVYKFPNDTETPFLWTEQTLVINEQLFPHLLSEDERLQKADIIKVFAIQRNLWESKMSTDIQMPMSVSLRVIDQQEAEKYSYSFEDYDQEMRVPSQLASKIKEVIADRFEQIENAESSWSVWSLQEKQLFVLQFIGREYEVSDDVDFIAELDLLTMDEIDAFFPIFLDEIKISLKDTQAIREFDWMNLEEIGDEEQTIKTLFNISFLKIKKSPDVSWTKILQMYNLLERGWLAKFMITNSKKFFDHFFKLQPIEIDQVVYLEGGRDWRIDEAIEHLAKLILLSIAKEDLNLKDIIADLSPDYIDSLFEGEAHIDSRLGEVYLLGKIEQMYDLFYFFITEGYGFDPIILKILFFDCKQDMKKFRAALWIASEHNLSSDEIKDLMRPDMTRFSQQSDGQKALAIFLDEKTELVINDGILSQEISAQSMGIDLSVGKILDPDASELALRRILQNVNSVEPGLGGSVHEAIKNSVQAINRVRINGLEVSDRIEISDFMEVNTDQDQGKYGFGFRLSDAAGWRDADEALRILTTPGKGEGLHSVHFLTLLKEYDVVRVRATDRQGKTALIEYRRVVDRHQQKVTDVRVRHSVLDSEHQPGTIIEGVKWTQYPQADSSIFRTSIDHFARNVPREEAEIVFDVGEPQSKLRNLNTSAEMILQPTDIQNFGTASITRTSREWHLPEVTIDHVPVKYDLVGMIRSIDGIPDPYQELLIGSGFTLNISNPKIAIVRSTLEFKDKVTAQKVLRQYLSENWQELFIQLFQRGSVNLAKGGLLTGDSWYDSALFGQHSQRDYKRMLHESYTNNWPTLTDKMEVATFCYFEPLIKIGNKTWSLAQIIEDQYKPLNNRQLQANVIPLQILHQIRNGKKVIRNDETQTASNTVAYIEASAPIKKILDAVDTVVRPYVDGTDDIVVKTHTGSFRGFGNSAFYTKGTVSFNLDCMETHLMHAAAGDPESLGVVLSIHAHELEHGKRRESESPFKHTQDFYAAVQDTILKIEATQMATLN